MSANPFFPQTLAQPQPTAIGPGGPRYSVKQRSSMAATVDRSFGQDRESFLNTLRQISKDKNAAKHALDPGRDKLSQNNAGDKIDFDSSDQSDVNPNYAAGHETPDVTMAVMKEKSAGNVKIQNTPGSTFLKIVKTLEESGLIDSTGGSDFLERSGGNPSIIENPDLLKRLIGRMGTNELGLSAELKNVLERIRQLIANAQARIASLDNNENDPDDHTSNRATALSNLDQLIKDMIQGEEDSEGSPVESRMGADHYGEKMPETVTKASRVLAESPVNSLDNESYPSPDDAGTSSKSTIGDTTGEIKLATETRKAFVDTIENAKIPSSADMTRPDVSRLEDGSESSAKHRTDSQDDPLNRSGSTANAGKQFDGKQVEGHLSDIASSQDPKQADDALASKALNQGLRHANQLINENNGKSDTLPDSKMAIDGQSAKAIHSGQRYAGESARENPAITESSPVSKMINDAQMAREHFIKMEATPDDDSGHKVSRIDSGAHDSGLMSSQNQTAEKTSEAAGFTRQTDTGSDNLRAHALDQIVKRAVINIKSGQHEARIDLKPDFLGHVRMQVTTENHQVTVKILTESPVVKDMIENNIQQLKSDLQQQGLNVDKLEVSISHNSDKYQNSRRGSGREKDRLRNIGLKNLKNVEEEGGQPAGNSSLRKAGESTVDYFA